MNHQKFGNITSDGLPTVIPGPGLDMPESSKLLFRERTKRYYIILYLHRKLLNRHTSTNPRNYSDILKLQIIDLEKRKERWIEKPAKDFCDRDGFLGWKSVPSVLYYMLNPTQIQDSKILTDTSLLKVIRSLESSLKERYEEFKITEMDVLLICSYCGEIYNGPMSHLRKRLKFCSSDCKKFYYYDKKRGLKK